MQLAWVKVKKKRTFAAGINIKEIINYSFADFHLTLCYFVSVAFDSLNSFGISMILAKLI